ncbi:MAG TPA: TIGR03790 family protein [Opitutaceae bacterium]
MSAPSSLPPLPPQGSRAHAMSLRPLRALLAALLAAAAALQALGSPDGGQVILVANSSAPGSEAIAGHYASRRSIPVRNIIALPMPTEETITWKTFIPALWQPLEDELVKRGLIDAIPMNSTDDVGRRKYSVSGHRIAALILCRGVPLRIGDDPTLERDIPGLIGHGQLKTNQGAVDSELSLLAQPGYPVNGVVTNPLFANDRPTAAAENLVVKVSRLDGPTEADAMHLVDLAIEAEHTGLLGRGYIDLAGPHESGDKVLNQAGVEIQALGFDLSVGRGPSTFPADSRIDAPVLYFGWYAQELNGPFALPGFRFPPGAVAVHIHSFSAETLRSATERWCGPLVDRGATATVGNVFEPYLEFTHRPDLLLKALARGDDLADAAYYALPVLSWQSILIGDPLYRPFKVALSSQEANLAALPPALAGYAVIRQMNLLDRQGKGAEAVRVGKAGLRDAPNLALAMAVAQRLAASGARDEAVTLLDDAVDGADSSAGSWDLLFQCASFMATSGRYAESIDVFRRLFSADAMPAELRATWLKTARMVALKGGDSGQAAEWNEELGRAAAAAARK